MLVLKRKVSEVIHLIEVGVTITVVEAREGSSRIGIEAPKEITIMREELLPPRVEAKAS